jgi:hypothetical protein
MHGTQLCEPLSRVIRRVAVDVSGQPYLDLERQAEAMLARE